ncbi:MAG: OmpA family protein [Flavobacteriales bacterium]|nr:OmpA family protein [Flavobacteriales bacterium]
MKELKLINIPFPCQADLDKSKKKDGGVLCDLCSKKVIDFSDFKDQEIIDVMDSAPQKVCGMFSQEQLSRPLQQNSRFKMTKRVASILSGMMLLNSASELTAQEVSDYQKEKDTLTQNSNPENALLKIQGTLLDYDDKPIAHAKINVNNITTVSTDANGKFTVDIQEKQLVNHCNFYVYGGEHGNRQFPYLKKDLHKPITLKYIKIEPKSCSTRIGEPIPKVAVTGRIQQVTFGRNSILPNDNSIRVLDNASKIVKEFFPNNTIIVEGNTDGIEKEELGMKRAEEVIKYLKEKGVNAENLIPVNKGFSEPMLSKCLLGECTENEHQMNRRVVFKLKD